MLGDGLTSSGATLAEHGGQVRGLGVDGLLVEGLSHIAFKSVWVDNLLDGLASFIDHGVCSGEIALLKSILSGTVADKDVVADAALAVNHDIFVVFELFLSSDHLGGLRDVFINGGRGGKCVLGLVFTDSDSAIFL